MDTELIIKELQFKAVRSSGPGGQHVNKTSSKVELRFNVIASEALSEIEKEQLQNKLATQINTDGFVVLHCGETRSQHRNKAIVIQRLLDLLTDNLRVKKKRKKTKPSKSAIDKRLASKKQQALKKSNRKPPEFD